MKSRSQKDKPLLSYEVFRTANELARSKTAGDEFAQAVLAAADAQGGAMSARLPATPPMAPQWKVGDKVALRGAIMAIDPDDKFLTYKVAVNGRSNGMWLPGDSLLPDGAPPTPSSDIGCISQRSVIAIGDWVSREELVTLKSELTAARAIIANRTPPHCSWVSAEEHEAIKVELEKARRDLAPTPNIDRYTAMQVGDLRGNLDLVASRLADKEIELGSLTREVTRLRKELREAQDKLARRGRL